VTHYTRAQLNAVGAFLVSRCGLGLVDAAEAAGELLEAAGLKPMPDEPVIQADHPALQHEPENGRCGEYICDWSPPPIHGNVYTIYRCAVCGREDWL
jgi:hypothetical protein